MSTFDDMLMLMYVCTCAMTTSVAAAMSNGVVDCGREVDFNATFNPTHTRIREQDEVSVFLTVPLVFANSTDLVVTSSDVRIMVVTSVITQVNSTQNELPGNFSTSDCNALVYPQLDDSNISTTVIVRVRGVRLGKADLIYSLRYQSNIAENSREPTETDQGLDGIYTHSDDEITQTQLPVTYAVVVLRKLGVQNTIFHIVVQVLLGILYFGFGCELDMDVVMSYIKKPLAPSIGFCSQFLLMPLLGIAITQILRMDPVFSIGLIAMSCAPGGGASNSWTLLLGGDVDLSLTMTFLSLVLALGMMPLWMFISSRIYFDSSLVEIPYVQIVTTLGLFVAPCFLGILLRKLKPRWSQPFTKVIKPISLLFLLWVLTFGTYVNLYMFKIMGQVPLTILAGILLPWCGFAFGFVISLATKQGRRRAVTIAIETGIQNIGIPIVLLQRSFPQPGGDLGATMVNSVAIFTPIPLFIALLVVTIKKRCCKNEPDKNIVTVEYLSREPIDGASEGRNALVSTSGVVGENDKKPELLLQNTKV